MNINAIGVTTFGNKVQLAKKVAMAAGAGSLLAATPAVDTFVKGISKPEKAIDEVDELIIKANDDGSPDDWNPFDSCC